MFKFNSFVWKKWHNIFVQCSILFLCNHQCLFAQNNRTISGKVTDGKNPVQGATVRLQAEIICDTTDASGFFQLPIKEDIENGMVTAWKEGYYNSGIEIGQNYTNIELALSPLPEDNADYEWIDPAPTPILKKVASLVFGEVKNCGDCHPDLIYKQWINNGHSQAAVNPIFLNLYNGTDSKGNSDIHPGYKLDYPHSAGNCSNCHAPAAAVRNPVGVDMNSLDGVEKMGVSCDFCHKIKDVQMQKNTSAKSGIEHMDLRRPPEGHQMFFGPYTDVPNPDAYSSTISESIFCAPCHEGGYWGVPVYESYSEWLASPYAKKGVTCQDCHMPPDMVTTNFAPGRGGVEREPMTIPSHFQLGSRDSTFLASAVEMQTKTKLSNGTLQATVEIENVAAGHHVPTDQPMRNMILVVTAVDIDGNNLLYTGGNRVPYWGGRGDPAKGYYEGLPGKGFAKILFEPNPQYVASKVGVKGMHLSPAPQWRVVEIKEDNRIPALETDVSVYDFQTNGKNLPIVVTTTLIYRRTFKNWSDMKKWNLKDIPLAVNSVQVN